MSNLAWIGLGVFSVFFFSAVGVVLGYFVCCIRMGMNASLQQSVEKGAVVGRKVAEVESEKGG